MAAMTRRVAAQTAPKVAAATDKVRGRAAHARAATVAALEDAAKSFTETLRRRGGEETPAAAAPAAKPASAPKTPPATPTH